ncbi:MAG TPA: hypothetical protein VEG29_03045 [Candidatus Binatia bacterium]|nr:hypothetical protein [Candidatus Binatia bacterium]
MDPRRPGEVAPPPEAVAFVRFCYRRRRVGWPELYDEMCAVASRGLYNGWGFTELAEHGIGFSLHETPGLAVIAQEVVREETERRRRVVVDQAVPASTTADVSEVATKGVPAVAPAVVAAVAEPTEAETAELAPTPVLRLAVASAG